MSKNARSPEGEVRENGLVILREFVQAIHIVVKENEDDLKLHSHQSIIEVDISHLENYYCQD
jgi:hypothetical protein